MYTYTYIYIYIYSLYIYINFSIRLVTYVSCTMDKCESRECTNSDPTPGQNEEVVRNSSTAISLEHPMPCTDPLEIILADLGKYIHFSVHISVFFGYTYLYL